MVLPDGDDLAGVGPDVPAAVDTGGVLKRPAGTGDDPAGGSDQLGHIATSYRQTDTHTEGERER